MHCCNLIGALQHIMGSTAAMLGEAQSVPEPEPELEPVPLLDQEPQPEPAQEPEPEQEPTLDAVLPEPGTPPTEAPVVEALDQSVEAVEPPQVDSAGADAHADEDGAPV